MGPPPYGRTVSLPYTVPLSLMERNQRKQSRPGGDQTRVRPTL